MIPYIVAVLFPLFVKIINKPNQYSPLHSFNRREERQRKLWVYVAALPMFVLIAFRSGSIGPDTGVYRWMFTHIISKDWSMLTSGERVETGFLVFEKVLSMITQDELVYQVIVAIIYYVSVVEFACNFKGVEFDFLYLYGTLGLYKFMFTGERQCLAMCICLWSYKLIRERRLIGFAALMALAFTFHKSAILFAPAYYMYNKKKSSVVSLLMPLAIVVLPFFMSGLQGWVANLLGYNEYGIESTQNGIISFITILAISLYSIYMIATEPAVERTGIVHPMNNISYFAVVFWVMRLITRVAERPSYYFMFFTMVVFAYCLSLFRDRNSRILITTAAYSLAFILFVYKMNTSLYIPYSFDWR